MGSLVQMVYIDKPVDWLHYALKIYILIIFEIWECAAKNSAMVIGFDRDHIP
jgi:hypothetical protein